MSDDTERHIAVIGTGFQLKNGGTLVHTLTIYGDQPVDRIATNKSRQRGVTLVDESLPDLLRTTADVIEQEGVEHGFAGVAAMMEAARGGGS